MKRDKRLKRYADKFGVEPAVLSETERHEWHRFANIFDAKCPIGLPPLPSFYFSLEEMELAQQIIGGQGSHVAADVSADLSSVGHVATE